MSGSDRAAGRANQKARTRAALLEAAVELVREGRPPSIPDAADRALISVATAYRYFPSADELWAEAAWQAVAMGPRFGDMATSIEAVGDDVPARVESLARNLGAAMLHDQVPFRRLAQRALDEWFRQIDVPPDERAPVRQGRRNDQIALALQPLEGHLDATELERLRHALAVVIGTDAMLAVSDAVGLDGADAEQTLVDAARWLLLGALAELTPAAGSR